MTRIDSPRPRLGWRSRVARIALAAILATSHATRLTGIQPPIDGDDEQFSSQLISKAPPAYKRLIDRGMVTFSRDDELLQRKKLIAATEFQLATRFELRYEANPSENNASPTLQIDVFLSRFEIQISHRVIVSKNSTADTLSWSDKILRHEFDHIAISTDPRIERLAMVLLRNRFRMIIPRIAGTFEETQLREQIQAEIDRRTDALRSLIQANYDLLDLESRNGQAMLQSREAFFRSLYSEENLQRHAFPYLTEVKKVFRDRRYQLAPRHYELLIAP